MRGSKVAIKSTLTTDEVIECIDTQLHEQGIKGTLVVPIGCTSREFDRVLKEYFPEVEVGKGATA